MFRTMKKHEQVLENALKALVRAVIYACNKFTSYSFLSEDVTIAFDDSIIEDKGAEQVRAQSEVGQGLKSKKTYLTQIKGMSEKEAEDELQKIQDEKMSNREAFGFEGNTEEE